MDGIDFEEYSLKLMKTEMKLGIWSPKSGALVKVGVCKVED